MGYERLIVNAYFKNTHALHFIENMDSVKFMLVLKNDSYIEIGSIYFFIFFFTLSKISPAVFCPPSPNAIPNANVSVKTIPVNSIRIRS